MHIINTMFGRGLGGIEQAFMDYNHALLQRGNHVTALIHPRAAIKPQLETLQHQHPDYFTFQMLNNYGHWDVFARSKAKKLCRQLHPDAVIVHGNRAARIMRGAGKVCPIIGITHNYSTKHLVGLDAIFTLTQDLYRHMVAAGQPEATLYPIPNMVTLPPPCRAPFHHPPVIGTMGRFVPKKGMDIFLQALALLQQRGVPFQAVIGGEGEEKAELVALVETLGLQDHVNFLGWVEDKAGFYQGIDIFCLPSHHEPFGIVLLEAFAHTMPVVTTASEGPSEIATDGQDALVVPIADPEAFAAALQRLIAEPDMAAGLAQQAYQTVATHYSMEVVSTAIHDALEQLIRHGQYR